VKVGSPVIRRVRITYRADGKPISASSSYFKGDLADRAPLLLSAERIREGTFTYVANTLKRTVDAWQDQFEPMIATPDEAARLGLEEGALIMSGRNWIYDDSGDVLEYGESITYGRVTYRGRLGE
jgi:DNA-binding GntR family transcriptional regulator